MPLDEKDLVKAGVGAALRSETARRRALTVYYACKESCSMKLLIAGCVIAHVVGFLPAAVCQEPSASVGKLNLAVGRSNLQADSIERELHYPSVVR
jgi:hypothetical protein